MLGLRVSRFNSRVLLYFHAQLPPNLRILAFIAGRVVVLPHIVRRDLGINNSNPGIVNSDYGIVNSLLGIANFTPVISSRKVRFHDSRAGAGDSCSLVGQFGARARGFAVVILRDLGDLRVEKIGSFNAKDAKSAKNQTWIGSLCSL